jgi:hypothetical protein
MVFDGDGFYAEGVVLFVVYNFIIHNVFILSQFDVENVIF